LLALRTYAAVPVGTAVGSRLGRRRPGPARRGLPLLVLTWLLSLLLSLAATSVSAQSPSDVLPSRFDFESTPGRLPKHARPLGYTLELTPSDDGQRFEARLEIELELQRAAPAIEFNALELRFARAELRRPDDAGAAPLAVRVEADDAREIARARRADGADIAAGRWRLVIDYEGRINRRSQGLFRIDYQRLRPQGGAPQPDYVLATQGQPSFMRQVLPCWDEPVFRASLALSLVIRRDWTAVSNMPLAEESNVDAGGVAKKRVRFERSVPMPSYLYAFFVGPWERLDDRHGETPLSILTPPGKREQARFAMDVTKAVLQEFERYFAQPYGLPKLDQVALPGGFGGAMENWGAIAYNEGALLFEPGRTPRSQLARIQNLVAHEIAHQWFGNRVTMAWWDDLWLNEGFASWLAARTTARLQPSWQTELADRHWREEALHDDALPGTHAVYTPVANEAQALALFDNITYSKGEAFIGMLESWLGDDAFRDGLRRYMAAHRDGSATTADLWHHLGAASGRNVAALASDWLLQPGYPLVQIDVRCRGVSSRVTLRQQRFGYDLAASAALTQRWNVPLALATTGHPPQRPTLPRAAEPLEIDLPGCSPVLVDADDQGFFRVQYDPFARKVHRAHLARYDAAAQRRLLSDGHALAMAGAAGFDEWFALLDALPADAAAPIWQQVAQQLERLLVLLDAPPGDGAAAQARRAARAALAQRTQRLLVPVLERLGLDERAGESPTAASARERLIEALATSGHAPTLAWAWQRLATYLQAPPGATPPSMAVMRAGGQRLDARFYDLAWTKLEAATSNDARWGLQAAMRSMRDPALLQRYLERVADGTSLPPGDAGYNLRTIGVNPQARDAARLLLLARFDALAERLGRYGRIGLAPAVFGHDDDEASEHALLALQRERIGEEGMSEAAKAVDWMRVKRAARARLIEALQP
jgi:aminopeptidase N